MKLAGARAVKATGVDLLPSRSNYFHGNDPAKWRRNVPNFGKVKYEGVYPGIDLVYYGSQRQLEYDFVVAPGADPKAIRFEIVGAGLAPPSGAQQAAPLRVDASGDLVVATTAGEVRFRKPVVFQEDSGFRIQDSGKQNVEGSNRQSKIGNRQYIEGRYVLRAAHPKSKIENPKYEVAFELAAYNPRLPLIIDPVLDYASFLGGDSFEQGLAIAVDPSSGAAYITGSTQSTNLPTPGGLFTTLNTDGADAFVSKISADGTTLDYSTYLGGTGFELGLGVAVDSVGNMLVTGYTFSTDFPTVNAYQSVNSTVPDAFLTKFDSAGTSLLYSTYLGGTGSDNAEDLAVDSSDSAYIVGTTYSTDFPTLNALQGSNAGAPDAFVAKLITTNTGAASLEYSTYFGGTGFELGFGIAETGFNAFIAGYTDSTDLPTTVPYQANNAGGADAFVLELGSAGDTALYATYLGGTGSDYATDIAVNSGGDAYFTGITGSSDFPIVAPFQANNGGSNDAFVSKFFFNGALTLEFSTYLGGADSDNGNAIALDPAGNVYVTGNTLSTDFPLASPLDSIGGEVTVGCEGPCSDAFISKLNAAGTALIFSTYLGTAEPDQGNGIATDGTRIYVTGETRNADFPATGGSFQPACATGLSFCDDAFVAEISGVILPVATLAPTSQDLGSIGVGFTTLPQTVTLTNNGDATLSFTSFNVQVSTIDPTPSPDFGQTNDCGVSLAPGGSCTITFTMTPTAAGLLSAVLKIVDNAYSTPTSGVRYVALTGTGTPAPAVSLSPTSLDFGSVNSGDTAILPVTLANTGTAALTITGIGATGNFSVQSTTCPLFTPIAASGTCTIDVLFFPLGPPGIFSAGLSVIDDAPGSPQEVALSGTGVQPIVSLSTTSIDFGNVLVGANSGFMNVTVTNIGDGILTFGLVGLVGTNAGYYSLANPCPATLAPTASCILSVAFGPSVLGSLPANLSIETDAPSSPDIVGLAGVGVQPAAGFTSTTVSFGSQLVGSASATQSVRFTNTGSATLNIADIELEGANRFEFSQTNDCGPSLAPTAFCDFVFAFTPGTPGSRDAQLTITDDAPGGPHAISLDGIGSTTVLNTFVAFTPATNYATGTTPFSVAAGDLNLDGKNDVVVANYDSGNVTVFLGNGDGSFPTGVDYPTGLNPHSVTIAEVTGDPDPDLLVASQNCSVDCTSGSVSLLPGNGNGTFQTATSIGPFSGPNGVAVGDFDHDGIPDLAVIESAGGSGSNLAVVLGTGNGNFGSPANYAVGLNPAAIAARDFNNDGELDFAVLNNIGSISILFGVGDGTFQAANSYTTGSFPNGNMGIADFNGDGSLDIAAAEVGSNSVGIFLNDGAGAFPTRSAFSMPGARAVAAADLNSDGFFDLVVANVTNPLVIGLVGNGAGGFPFSFEVPTPSVTRGIAAADFNGDGMPDLALAGSMAVALNTAAKLSTTSLSFGNKNVGTVSSTQSVFLTNASNTANVNISSVGTSGDFDVIFENCTTSSPLSPGQGCQVDVAFAPTALGAANATLSIATDAVGTPHIISLTGTGTQPAVSLSQTNINFGSVFVGGTTGFTFVNLTNTGTGTLTISAFVLTGTNSADFVPTNGCFGAVAPGLSCSFGARFAPTQVGPLAAQLEITDDASGSPHIVTLSGTGVAPPIPTFDVSNLTFPAQNVGTTSDPPQEVILTNTGLSAMAISSINVTGDFGIASHNCPASLASNANCTINVTSNPVHLGALNGQLLVASDAPGSPHTVALAGTGAGVPFARGEVFVGGPSQVQRRSATGQLIQIIDTTSGVFTTGMVFDSAGNLYVTAVSPTINKFDNVGNFLGNFGSGLSTAESILFDAAGNVLVGDVGGGIHKFDPSGVPITVFIPGVRVDWMDLAADQKTMLFGQEGTNVLTVDVETGLAGPDFATGLGGNAFALRFLSDGGILLANRGNILRLNSLGQVIQTYDAAGEDNWFALNLDPDGTSFWSADFGTSNFYKFDIASGNVLVGPVNTGTATFTVFGLVVNGEITAARTTTLSLSRSSVNFPGNPLNLNCPTKDVVVTNTGDLPLTFTNINILEPFLLAAGTTCSTTTPVGLGLTCVFKVKFAPTGVGPANSTLTFASNAIGNPHTVNLTGNGTPACSLLAKVRSVTVLRGTDVQDFAIEDAKPSCSPVSLNLTCSVDNPAACLLTPAVIAPSGASTLQVSNLKRVGSDALQITVTSTSEFRTASELVTVHFADFAFTKSPEVATVGAGGATSYSLAVRPVNGLSGNVAFTCSGAPRGATCAVEPSSITLDGASVEQVKVKVSTAGRAGAVPMGGIKFGDGLRRVTPLLAMLLGLMMVLILQKSRRVKEQLCATRLAFAVVLLAMLVWASCGGGGSMGVGASGTPAGNYTLTITGTYSSATGATPGTLANSTTVTLRVN